MGQDAGIFSIKAKTYFWFDRLYNIESFYDLFKNDIPINSSENEIPNKCYFIKDKLMNGNASKAEVEYLCNICIECYNNGAEDKEYHIEWLKHIKYFIEMYPNDNFFVVSDFDIKYPDILDDYKEIKQDDLRLLIMKCKIENET